MSSTTDVLDLTLRTEDEEWQQYSLCAQVDPDLWYPESGGAPAKAKKICGDCDVRAECLLKALRDNEDWGIWGGFTDTERREVKKQISQKISGKMPTLRDVKRFIAYHKRKTAE